MEEALTQLRDSATQCAASAAFALSDQQLLDGLQQLHSVVQVLTAGMAHLVREISARDLPTTLGATGTIALLRDRLRLSPHAASALVRLSGHLDARPGLDAAVCDGAVSAEQALAIGAAVAELPGECGTEVVDQAQMILIGQAGQYDPTILKRLGARILQRVAPEVAERAEQRTLEREEKRAFATRELFLTDADAGRVRITGWLDQHSAAILRAALEPLCKPVPDDARSAAERRHDALTDVCQLALRTGQLPDRGGQPTQLVVTVPFDVLTGKVGAGTLDTGQKLSAEQVRYLACDALIIPAVLNGTSVPINLGRGQRTFRGAARRALILRDRGCSFPGCDRSPKWCEGHHIREWGDLGATDQDNGVLVCAFHHRLLHHGWDVRIAADKHPEFLPPTYIDPLRHPRRNTHHHHPLTTQHRTHTASLS